MEWTRYGGGNGKWESKDGGRVVSDSIAWTEQNGNKLCFLHEINLPNKIDAYKGQAPSPQNVTFLRSLFLIMAPAIS